MNADALLADFELVRSFAASFSYSAEDDSGYSFSYHPSLGAALNGVMASPAAALAAAARIEAVVSPLAGVVSGGFAAKFDALRVRIESGWVDLDEPAALVFWHRDSLLLLIEGWAREYAGASAHALLELEMAQAERLGARERAHARNLRRAAWSGPPFLAAPNLAAFRCEGAVLP